MLALRERTVVGLLDRALAGGESRELLRFESERYTYAEADRRSDAAAAALAAGGVAKGSHVALMLDNSPDFLWVLLALAKLGAVGVPLNTEAKGSLLRYYLSDSNCNMAVVDGAYRATVAAALEPAEPIDVAWVRGGDAGGARFAREILDLDSELERDHGAPPSRAPVTYRDVWLLMYTSGTTGPSKAIVVSNAHAVTTGLIVAERFQLCDRDRMYTCLPMFHVNALWYTTLAAMSIGASIVLARRFSASRFWEDIRRFEATEVNAMGSMMQILDKRPPSEAERNNPLTKAFVVPFPSDPAAFERRYGAQLMTTYALSEWIPVALSAPGEGYDRPGMAGPILEYSAVKIVDEEDVEVPTGTTGEIVLRGHEPWVALREYYGKPAETVHAFRNLWFHTGDLGYVDGDGYLYFVGRKKDAIRRRGENISAYELEEMLREHGGIQEVAAIPVPSELGEDDVAVYVVPQPGTELTPAAIASFARDHLPRYMRPRFIEVVDELPKTATSKVEKYKLVERATGELERLWEATKD